MTRKVVLGFIFLLLPFMTSFSCLAKEPIRVSNAKKCEYSFDRIGFCVMEALDRNIKLGKNKRIVGLVGDHPSFKYGQLFYFTAYFIDVEMHQPTTDSVLLVLDSNNGELLIWEGGQNGHAIAVIGHIIGDTDIGKDPAYAVEFSSSYSQKYGNKFLKKFPSKAILFLINKKGIFTGAPEVVCCK